MRNEVVDFINRRFVKDCDWSNGNCYYFALILSHRFPTLRIVYLPVRGHFAVIDNLYLYDYEGAVGLNEITELIYPLDKLKEDDPKWYAKLFRDCIK